MLGGLLKIKIYSTFIIISIFAIKYFFIDDPEVHKFVKLAHLYVKLERYFIGVGYDHFNRNNIISRLGLSKKYITENHISNHEILKYYEIQSLIDDEKIKIKIIAKKNALKESMKLPSVVYIHGGGYVFRGIETNFYKHFTDLNFIFIFIYYRLAPEYKFPTQIEDSFSVLNFLAEMNASNKKYSEDPEISNILSKIDKNDLVLMGDSAGGNIVGSLTLLAKERGLTDRIKIQHQIFIFTGMFHIGELPSRKKYENWYFISKKEIVWFVEKYLKSEEDINNKLICPMKYEDEFLKDLPSSYFIFAERDSLFSEGELYKDRLIKLWNRVSSHIYKAEHGFIFFEGIIPEADLAVRDLMEYIKKEYKIYDN